MVPVAKYRVRLRLVGSDLQVAVLECLFHVEFQLGVESNYFLVQPNQP